MDRFWKQLSLVLFLGLLGALLSSWFSPRMIAWYFEPPVNIGINCRGAQEWAMGKLRNAQIFGSLLGIFISVVFLGVFKKRSSGPGVQIPKNDR